MTNGDPELNIIPMTLVCRVKLWGYFILRKQLLDIFVIMEDNTLLRQQSFAMILAKKAL